MVVECTGYVGVICDETFDDFTSDAGIEVSIRSGACYICAARGVVRFVDSRRL